MTTEEKKLLLQEIPKYIKENCYYSDGSIKRYDLWLIGWVANEFNDRKNAMKVLINNEYGLLGNLLNKLARTPDVSITKFIEQADLEILIKAMDLNDKAVILRNNLHVDPYAMRLLLKHNVKYLDELSGQLLRSKKFILSVVDVCPEIVKNVTASMFKEEDFALCLVKKNHMCLKYLPQRFCQDYRLCSEAAQQEGFSLMYFDLAIRDCDEIVLKAVSNRGNALSMASPRQKKNRNIVYAAVKSCGLALSYADLSLKSDFDIVSLAVNTHGIALRYAAPELQDCEEIVRIAVKNDGYAIQSASERLRDNYELALLAISSATDAYKYLSPRLQNNPEIKSLYTFKKEEDNKWLLSKMR